MFTRDDLLDALARHLTPPEALKAASLLKGRPFVTEYDIKRALTPGARHLTIPKDAIVSPLAQDWLALRDITIVRSS